MMFLALMMEAVHTPETSAYSKETTRLYIPEDSNLHKGMRFSKTLQLLVYLEYEHILRGNIKQ
jgi:hypothetical protein